MFFKAEYNKEVRKIKLSEIEVQLRKYKNLIQELLKDYEQNILHNPTIKILKKNICYKLINRI
mgnify:FL=1